MPLQNIKIGNYDIFDSGTLLVIKNHPVKFQLTETLILFLNYYEDPAKPENHQEYRRIDANSLEYNLYNVNAPTGRGFTNIWKIGTILNRQVYFDYRITHTKDSTVAPLLHYTFYLGEEVLNA